MRRDPVIIVVEPYGGSPRRQLPQMPHIYYDDLGVTRGDGIFETLLVHDGHTCNQHLHEARFAQSAAKRDFAHGVGAIITATDMALESWVEHCHGELVDAKMVWTLTRGRISTGHPTAWITISELDDESKLQTKGAKVMLAEKGFTLHPDRAPWIGEAAKTLGYAATLAALRQAQAQGLDDVIWVDGDRVLEGSTSSVVTVKGQKIRTPAHGPDVLPGTTQQAIFALGEQAGYRCSERELSVDKLYEADSVWLVSSTRGPVPVRAIGEKKLHPQIDEAVRELLWEAVYSR